MCWSFRKVESTEEGSGFVAFGFSLLLKKSTGKKKSIHLSLLWKCLDDLEAFVKSSQYFCTSACLPKCEGQASEQAPK